MLACRVGLAITRPATVIRMGRVDGARFVQPQDLLPPNSRLAGNFLLFLMHSTAKTTVPSTPVTCNLEIKQCYRKNETCCHEEDGAVVRLVQGSSRRRGGAGSILACQRLLPNHRLSYRQDGLLGLRWAVVVS